MWICPVCNGLESLTYTCPQCANPVDDLGKLSDYDEPYSPYREINDMKLSNGYPDLVQHQCIHLLHCPNCKQEMQVALDERYVPDSPDQLSEYAP
ncbi:uncharacterized protein YbaR (Trm112 family) [Caldalkalibacillus uzonensis]|uniref:Uncharacterized protein YbaR (Trm112 family) n=1 Tax=Caldalkalibacillus uzonensis TaxID=353224 RepID=A0ABU0CW20_9BACI|nr:hypothetical protein [Caldalkalibacillus uzonensis]MDQ0340332.1 uncharacterized protein YbaR (Trm112 family) [Caldalkalibacillus uzonensis]